jgi:ATP-binding cassette subfamily F protein uup
VLDEPTNHLDVEGIIWLEKLLKSQMEGCPQAYCLVSHDRQFLENSVNRVIELSPVYANGTFQVNGSYSVFLEKKEEMLAQQQEREERLANKVRREVEWLRRGPKARTSKARYRIESAGQLQDDLHRLRAQNRAQGAIKVDFDSTGRKTKKLLEAKGLAKCWGDVQLFSGLDILLTPGTRLGLLGRNGCGKSTLMQILAGAAEDSGYRPDAGTIKLAPDVRIVSFDQRREMIDPEQTLRQALAPEGDSVLFQGRLVHVVTWAKRFLFRPDQLDSPVGRLSGGEQARILIAGLMRQAADILLLDEPTNDLDIASLDVLEQSLTDFPGALVLVSHDRFMLGRLCDQVIGFTGRGQALYFADYEQWLAAISAKGQNIPVEEQAKERKKSKTVGRLSYMDQREYDGLEDKITEAESSLDEINTRINDPEIAANPELLEQYWREQQQLQQEVERLYSRWEELEEKKR